MKKNEKSTKNHEKTIFMKPHTFRRSEGNYQIRNQLLLVKINNGLERDTINKY